MDIHEAQLVCGSPRKTVFINCPVCDARTAIHCTRCNIQILGCGCTMREKIEAEEKAARAERLKQQGVWIPDA
jgi:hypothetical protein